LYEISNVIGIWSPIIAFGHLLSYEKTKFYGDDKHFAFLYVNKYLGQYDYIVYHEEVQLSVSCRFNFTKYPFDSHRCTLEFGCPKKSVGLKPSRIIYENLPPHRFGELPIILRDLPHPYEFEFKFKPAFQKFNADNYSTSYSGMEIKMKRKTLGELLIGYYYPMAAFAILSMISFLINPDVVSCNCYFH
jgi:hypothetical protein